MIWGKPVTFVNATVIGADGQVWTSLRVRGGFIDSLGAMPQRGDAIVDTEGSIVCAGLINAHDHLELNSFARLKWRPRYANVREWIADFQPRFRTDPALVHAQFNTLRDRLWVGGLKNLLSGVTTVCHHNPLHRPLRRRFPVRVVRRYGLSHSLQIDGDRVSASYRCTPSSWPWIIHAAEGVDSEAGDEVKALARLQCLGRNTVLVHGVAIDTADARHVLQRGASLIWCPTSNEFLFGQTANARPFAQARQLALGTDSRLSGQGDLLDELRAAAATGQLAADALVRAVTIDAAGVLRLRGAGQLQAGAPADVVVLRRTMSDPFASIVGSRRADLRLTMIDGMPLVGDEGMRSVFRARRQRHVTAYVDGSRRLLAAWIARRSRAMVVREPGLEVPW